MSSQHTNGSTSTKDDAKNSGRPRLRPPPLGSCHWIDWDSDFIQNKMIDPTRLFSFLVCVVMFVRYLEGSQWDWHGLGTGFFGNPFVVSCFITAVVTLYLGLAGLAKQQQEQQQQAETSQSPSSSSSSVSFSSLRKAWQSLPVYDRWTAEWYWWNAWLYHGVMDGAAGTLQAVPVVLSQYRILDRRFSTHHPVPWVVGLVEILVHQPACLASLYAVLTNSPYRYPLEIIVAILHMFGAVAFVLPEVMEGQLNVPALDPIGIPGNRFGNLQWTNMDQFVYYWFGFWFCNCVWIWVPLYRLQRAMQECVRALQQQQEQQQQINNNISSKTKHQ